VEPGGRAASDQARCLHRLLRGNHSYNYALSDAAANGASTKGFGGLPTTAPDPRFATVTQIYDMGYGNYDGLTLAERHAFAHGFQASGSYTYSKALAQTTIYNPVLYSLASLVTTGKKTDSYGPTAFDTRHNSPRTSSTQP